MSLCHKVTKKHSGHIVGGRNWSKKYRVISRINIGKKIIVLSKILGSNTV